jgi:type IV secretion system protein TrbL
MPCIDVPDRPNPFEELGDIIAKAAADAWTAAMLAIWNSGLFVLRIVLPVSELFLTPDLRGDGPGKGVYEFTLLLALALVVILVMIQLGAAAFKREGKGLARAFIGAGQFVVVCACWFGYCHHRRGLRCPD